MKTTSALTSAAAAAVLLGSTLVSAAPTSVVGPDAAAAHYHPIVRRAAEINDTVVLNFALTLEHLENAFYHGALAKYDTNAFVQAGYPSWVRGRYQEIADHEDTHVNFLTSALGSAATKACNYSFPYTDVKSFVALSQAVEGTGVVAYTGAAQLISNKQYLTDAASILATEARQSSWIDGPANKLNPWSGAFDVPLPLNAVYTIAAAFITSCPSTNPALPVKAFPKLTLGANVKPGQSTSVSFNATGSANGTLYAAFYTGLSQIVVPLQGSSGSYTVQVPQNITGTTFAVITTNSTASSDATTVAGPAVVIFPFNSSGQFTGQAQEY